MVGPGLVRSEAYIRPQKRQAAALGGLSHALRVCEPRDYPVLKALQARATALWKGNRVVSREPRVMTEHQDQFRLIEETKGWSMKRRYPC